MRKISQYLNRWPIALFATLVLAAAILLPGLSRPGLWEPGERMLADRIAPPDPVQVEIDEKKLRAAQGPQQPKAPEPTCRRSAPENPLARSLANRAMTLGRD